MLNPPAGGDISGHVLGEFLDAAEDGKILFAPFDGIVAALAGRLQNLVIAVELSVRHAAKDLTPGGLLVFLRCAVGAFLEVS